MRWMRAFILAVVGLAFGLCLGPELPGARALPASIAYDGAHETTFTAVATRLVDPRVQACLVAADADRVAGSLIIDASGAVSFVPKVADDLPESLVACLDAAVRAGPVFPTPWATPRSASVGLSRLFDKGDGYAFSAPRGKLPSYVTVDFITAAPVLLHRRGLDVYVTGGRVALDLPRGTYRTWTQGVAGELEVDGPGTFIAHGDTWEVIPAARVEPVPGTPDRQAWLASQARYIPHADADGNLDGYRIAGMRRSSALALAGLQNGDVVHRVNGIAVAPDVDAVLPLLDVAGALEVDLTRRGEPLRLDVVLP